MMASRDFFLPTYSKYVLSDRKFHASDVTNKMKRSFSEVSLIVLDINVNRQGIS